MSKLFTPKNVIAILFILVIAFIHFFSHNFIDNRASDLFTKMHANFINKSASENVVLVVIDDKSLKKIPWPWQRNLYSDIFDYLEFYAGAKVIAFQNLVIYPDTYYPENDKYFYSNLAKHNILINSYILSGSNVSGDVLPPEYINAFLEKSNVNILDMRTNNTETAYKGVIKLPKMMLLNSKYFASSFIQEDKDEIVRNYIPFVN
ncbi:MAG: CHASE2 domain-containing protein, partial [Candidatus Avigastranaerophilus sp.]